MRHEVDHTARSCVRFSRNDLPAPPPSRKDRDRFFAVYIVREIAGARSFFSPPREKARDKVNIGMSECKKGKGAKKIAQQPREIANRAGGTLPLKLKPPATKLLHSIRNTSPSYTRMNSLDSEE